MLARSRKAQRTGAAFVCQQQSASRHGCRPSAQTAPVDTTAPAAADAGTSTTDSKSVAAKGAAGKVKGAVAAEAPKESPKRSASELVAIVKAPLPVLSARDGAQQQLAAELDTPAARLDKLNGLLAELHASTHDKARFSLVEQSRAAQTT